MFFVLRVGPASVLALPYVLVWLGLHAIMLPVFGFQCPVLLRCLCCLKAPTFVSPTSSYSIRFPVAFQRFLCFDKIYERLHAS